MTFRPQQQPFLLEVAADRSLEWEDDNDGRGREEGSSSSSSTFEGGSNDRGASGVGDGSHGDGGSGRRRADGVPTSTIGTTSAPATSHGGSVPSVAASREARVQAQQQQQWVLEERQRVDLEDDGRPLQQLHREVAFLMQQVATARDDMQRMEQQLQALHASGVGGLGY
jgi:hypothetical protein